MSVTSGGSCAVVLSGEAVTVDNPVTSTGSVPLSSSCNLQW